MDSWMLESKKKDEVLETTHTDATTALHQNMWKEATYFAACKDSYYTTASP